MFSSYRSSLFAFLSTIYFLYELTFDNKIFCWADLFSLNGYRKPKKVSNYPEEALRIESTKAIDG